VAQSEIVHAFLEGTTCRDFVRELGRSPPVDSNELFDIATGFASGEEAVVAIFGGKKGKRTDDAPAEGSKSKELHRKDKRGKKGKKPHREARKQGRDGNDAKALAVDRLDGALDRPLRSWGVRRHAEEAMSITQDTGEPHPRAMRLAQAVLWPRRRE
jgi:hypothetical protein